MKKIINLLKNAEVFMNAVLEEQIGNDDIFPVYRGEEHYSIKYPFREGNAIITVDVTPSFYKFHVAPEGSALMMAKPKIPTFDVGLSLTADHRLRKHMMPKDKEACIWLDTLINKHWKSSDSASTYAEYLVVLATTCEIIWSNFIPAMKMREYGDTVEYAPRDDYATFLPEFTKVKRIEWKQKHLLEGWDTVSLTMKQYSKLLEYAKPLPVEYNLDNMALPSFCFILYNNGKHSCTFFKRVNDTVEISCDILESAGQNKMSFTVQIANGTCCLCTPVDDATREILETVIKMSDDGSLLSWQWIAMNYLVVNTFMLHYSDISMDVEEKVCKAPTEAKQSKKSARNTTRLFKSYTLTKNWSRKVAHRHMEITCPAWGVRGHFRHYKSGKVVFVESFVKGKERDKYQGKEYALISNKDA